MILKKYYDLKHINNPLFPVLLCTSTSSSIDATVESPAAPPAILWCNTSHSGHNLQHINYILIVPKYSLGLLSSLVPSFLLAFSSSRHINVCLSSGWSVGWKTFVKKWPCKNYRITVDSLTLLCKDCCVSSDCSKCTDRSDRSDSRGKSDSLNTSRKNYICKSSRVTVYS